MDAEQQTLGSRCVLDVASLARLIDSLQRRGYEVVGPRVQDGAIVYGILEKLEDLPVGRTDEQQPGKYRLKQRDDQALFGCAVGPQSWKKYLYPPEVRLFEAERDGQSFRILNMAARGLQGKYAFFGVRACELAAITVQDRVLLGDRYTDATYRGRRQGVFIVAVQCTHASSSCFCTSMGTGPPAEEGFDLALTEIAEGDLIQFVVEVGSEAGAEILAELDARLATPEETQRAAELVEETVASITRRMDTTGIRELLYDNFDHPRWDDVAGRCLSCANCTLVCPTCFCTSVEDGSDVTGVHAERWRRWDSCFVQNFSYIHGGAVRMSVKSRYRQWLTHKLAAWIDQFGTSGCVGCGRCITWCPAGIDITEEVAAIREGEATNKTEQRATE
jgi:ferredoxin